MPFSKQKADTSKFHNINKKDILSKIDAIQRAREWRPLFPEEVMNLTVLQDLIFEDNKSDRFYLEGEG